MNNDESQRASQQGTAPAANSRSIERRAKAEHCLRGASIQKNLLSTLGGILTTLPSTASVGVVDTCSMAAINAALGASRLDHMANKAAYQAEGHTNFPRPPRGVRGSRSGAETPTAAATPSAQPTPPVPPHVPGRSGNVEHPGAGAAATEIPMRELGDSAGVKRSAADR